MTLGGTSSTAAFGLRARGVTDFASAAGRRAAAVRRRDFTVFAAAFVFAGALALVAAGFARTATFFATRFFAAAFFVVAFLAGAFARVVAAPVAAVPVAVKFFFHLGFSASVEAAFLPVALAMMR